MSDLAETAASCCVPPAPSVVALVALSNSPFPAVARGPRFHSERNSLAYLGYSDPGHLRAQSAIRRRLYELRPRSLSRPHPWLELVFVFAFDIDRRQSGSWLRGMVQLHRRADEIL